MATAPPANNTNQNQIRQSGGATSRKTIHGKTIISRLTSEPPRNVISCTTLLKQSESVIGIRTKITPKISCSRLARVRGSVPRRIRRNAFGILSNGRMFCTDSRMGKTLSGMAIDKENASPARTQMKAGFSGEYRLTMFGA